MKPNRTHEIMRFIQNYDTSAQEQSVHLRAEEQLRKFLSDTTLNEEQRTFLKYQLAIALDLGGKPLDSLELFHEVIAADPHNQEFQQSMLVIHSRVVVLATQVMIEDESNPVLLNYHEILNAHHFSPDWLCFAVARQFAATGRRVQARALAESVHQACLNDPDSLRECLRVARICEDRAWEAELVERVEDIRERRPYDPRYLDLG